ncbi:hypothetical protein RhiirC2_777668 [Rhizophagus irregularis]|uniref:Uncharacterized protein n=1 Tax=Rhizophagus irregularis TaxID=588596 RepID=A0A2N1NDS9_9GLOM|nr:hypothetical protein RhiirC2_777668 [Rhizophagus irregularis]
MSVRRVNRTCKGERGNYNINGKFYGVDSAIVLINNSNRKHYIRPKDFAITGSVFKDNGLELIIKDINLFHTSKYVIKVRRPTGLPKEALIIYKHPFLMEI